ncbi:MAG TPA: hypothetical protein VIO15_08355, partial [Bacteroidales bacterium]
IMNLKIFAFVAGLILFNLLHTEAQPKKAVLSGKEFTPHSIFIHYPSTEHAWANAQRGNEWMLNLNGSWLYNTSGSTARLTPDRKGFNPQEWQSFQVPSNIFGEQTELDTMIRPKGNKVILRKFFPIPESWYGLQTELVFEGIGPKGVVLVNGMKAANISNNQYGLFIEITPLLRFGKMNSIDIILENVNAASADSLAGLFGNVALYAHPNVAISDYTIQATPASPGNEGKIDITLFPKRYLEDIDDKFTIEMYLYDKKRNNLLAPVALKYNPSKKADSVLFKSMTVKGAQAWTSCQPVYYTLLILLKDKQKQVVEAIKQIVAFRDFRYEGDSIIINGKRDTCMTFKEMDSKLAITGEPFEKDKLYKLVFTSNLQPTDISNIIRIVRKYRNNLQLAAYELKGFKDDAAQTIKAAIEAEDKTHPVKY